jgi:phosphoribosyl 1,2-cyclic phosphate phosphodiesterase
VDIVQLTFLGSGDEQGVPRVGCDCDVCRDAQAQENRSVRTSPSIVLHYGPSFAERVILVDAAPEFRLQATRLGIGPIDAALLTHAHDGHILGLRTVADTQRRLSHPITVQAPGPVLDDVQERFGPLWADKTYRRVWQPQAIEQEVDLWAMRVRPLRVNHGIGGTAYGYLFSYDEIQVAYVSDMLRASPEVRQALTGLDLLVLGTSHYYESIDEWKRSVMDIMSALELIREVSPGQAILTHLSHTIDYDKVSENLPANVRLAYDGLTMEVEP